MEGVREPAAPCRPSDLMQLHLKAIIDGALGYGFAVVGVFGSVAKRVDSTTSDLDLYLVPGPDAKPRAEELFARWVRNLIKCDVDVVVDVGQRGEIIDEIRRTARVLWPAAND